ncbi:MAG TPA: hypothetical protein VGZ24_03460 [Chthoniobacterales bacterium]|nr:hypothetical protein [Chthoniobacterales bacterium]
MHTILRSRASAATIEAVSVALLLTALLFFYRPAFYIAGSRMDEAVLLVFPELLLHGKVPYRDFETFYGPANLWILAAAFRFFGATVEIERTVGLTYRFALFAALYFAVRRWGKAAAIGVVLIAAFALLPLGSVANAWIVALALAVVSIALMTKQLMALDDHSSAAAIAGLSAGVAVLFRVDLAPAIIASAALLLWASKPKQRYAYGIGLVAGGSPLLISLFTAGLKNVMENIFLYPVIYTNAARRLPLFGRSSEIAIYALVIAGAAALTLSLGALGVWKKRGDRESVSLLALGCLGIFAVPQALQRADYFHAAMTAPVTIALLPAVAAAAVKLSNKPALASSFAVLATTACFSALWSIAPQSTDIFSNIVHNQLALSEIPQCAARGGNRKFPLSSPDDAQSVTKICSAITQKAHAGERLFVGPRDLRRTNYNDVYFYYLLPQLTPASYFIEMNPLSANRPDSRLASDIATADWIILDSQLDSFHEANASEQLGSNAPMLVIHDRFTQVAQLRQFSMFHRLGNL